MSINLGLLYKPCRQQTWPRFLNRLDRWWSPQAISPLLLLPILGCGDGFLIDTELQSWFCIVEHRISLDL